MKFMDQSKLDVPTQVIIPGMQVRFGRYLQQEYMTSANFYGNNKRTPILPSGKLT